jgi:LysM repeat protein
VVITIKKSLLTLSVVAGVLGFSGVAASASTYTVKSGDTLAEIAAKHNDSVDGIAKRNKLTDKNLILVGQKLEIGKNAKASTSKANKKHLKTSTSIKKGSAHTAVTSQSSSDSSSTTDATSSATTTPEAFQSQGVIYQDGKKWTYYTGAAFADGTTNHGGYDADGYLIVAAPSDVPFGTHVQTPLGEGVVHDRGTAIVGNHYDLVMP